MNRHHRYTIAHKELTAGAHRFDFEVDDQLFKEFENSDIIGCRAHVVVDMVKDLGAMTLNVDIDGVVQVLCDRCLDECELEVDYQGVLVVREVDESEIDYDGDVMGISRAAGEIDLGQYIYESILISLPFQWSHQEGDDGELECNPEMLGRFRIVSGEEFDKIEHEAEPKIEVDPQVQQKLLKLKQELEDK